jgi:inorganic pyrophosphatase
MILEDPDHTTPETGTKGDSDPLDVCEIGYKVNILSFIFCRNLL